MYGAHEFLNNNLNIDKNSNISGRQKLEFILLLKKSHHYYLPTLSSAAFSTFCSNQLYLVKVQKTTLTEALVVVNTF